MQTQAGLGQKEIHPRKASGSHFLFLALPLALSVSVRLGWALSDGLMCGALICSEPGQAVPGVSTALVGSHGHPWAKSLVLAECEALIGWAESVPHLGTQ